MASRTDLKLASLAAGFTLGFGFLTIWKAVKQTRQIQSPLGSIYIYMVWGEIISNVCIGVFGWLFLEGTIAPHIGTLVLLLVLWVFEVQLLMQIIINRMAIIAESQRSIKWLKWSTATVITAVNVAVFCIWIPAHMKPPLSPRIVTINKYWEPSSKVIIYMMDAYLNCFFLSTVRSRLIKYHRLSKYEPLVVFNGRIVAVSIAMDVMIIGLMALPNKVVYIQFHPVAYMIKLNIEMSMANLITQLARSGSRRDTHFSTNFDFRSRIPSITGHHGLEKALSYDRKVSVKSFAPSDYPDSQDAHMEGATSPKNSNTDRENGPTIPRAVRSLDDGKPTLQSIAAMRRKRLMESNVIPLVSPRAARASLSRRTSYMSTKSTQLDKEDPNDQADRVLWPVSRRK